MSAPALKHIRRGLCSARRRPARRNIQCSRPGNNGEKVTPVPIPNTEVKLLSADGSWGFTPVRVGRCQANERQPVLGCLFLCQ